MTLKKGQAYVLMHPSQDKPGFCWGKKNNELGWTNSTQHYIKYSSESLHNALIQLSAMDIEAVPGLMTSTPVQLTEGEDAGKWVLELNFMTLRREKV